MTKKAEPIETLFTDKDVDIFWKLYRFKEIFRKPFKPDCLTNIACQIDGANWSSSTRQSLVKLAKLGCLRYSGLKESENSKKIRRKKIEIFDVDIIRMKQLWKGTKYYNVSQTIIEEDSKLIIE